MQEQGVGTDQRVLGARPCSGSRMRPSGGFRRAREPPHAAAADFDLVRLVGGAEVGRDRWTRSLQFTFIETVEPELMIVNPMGLIITYLRGDRALVTG